MLSVLLEILSVVASRTRSSLRRPAVASAGLLALSLAASAQTPEVHLAVDTQLLTRDSPRPTKHLPVLFVHGHNLLPTEATDPNYKKNWQDKLRALLFSGDEDLPSFRDSLRLRDNDSLDIEEYYIRFLDQGRSIARDAADIGAAVELILHRHDPEYPDVRPTTTVQVVIIAYSKGTISTRLYLKNLAAEGRSFNPVSEFIAIAPPNHGLNSEFGGSTCAGQQLMNGMDASCNALSQVADCAPAPLGFFRFLNGHPDNDTARLDGNDNVDREAPGSRSDLDADGKRNPPTKGTLYVTLFAKGNRDFCGRRPTHAGLQGPPAGEEPEPEGSQHSGHRQRRVAEHTSPGQ